MHTSTRAAPKMLQIGTPTLAGSEGDGSRRRPAKVRRSWNTIVQPRQEEVKVGLATLCSRREDLTENREASLRVGRREEAQAGDTELLRSNYAAESS